MSEGKKSTLFVSGVSLRTRAKDLAYEFERYGRLVRCDIPAPRHGSRSPATYAFVEFEDRRDAEDAYYEMQGRRFDGFTLDIQWAKSAPSRTWRYDDRRDSDRPRSRDSGRDRDRERDREPDRDGRDNRDDRDDRDRDRDRRRSRSPRRGSDRDDADRSSKRGDRDPDSKDGVLSPRLEEEGNMSPRQW
ncbi:RNA-binding domain-containing protein [Polychytrium aggregatum]|uniref:RNA-binding domain-containing protein n=1 Tax=Polychytrium aggregatum TaxID=110093 RepID=UPI0022FEFE7D|nr:RNA-binding domain-containing protein [Polychytrium aggregatum]KAI9209248.1 RNA-binding domain-containing protein [Polychytrium aggregatum]